MPTRPSVYTSSFFPIFSNSGKLSGKHRSSQRRMFHIGSGPHHGSLDHRQPGVDRGDGQNQTLSAFFPPAEKNDQHRQQQAHLSAEKAQYRYERAVQVKYGNAVLHGNIVGRGLVRDRRQVFGQRVPRRGIRISQGKRFLRRFLGGKACGACQSQQDCHQDCRQFHHMSSPTFIYFSRLISATGSCRQRLSPECKTQSAAWPCP